MKTIPLIDLKKQYYLLKEEIDGAISKTLENSAFIKVKEIDDFEKNFSEYCGKDFCAAVDNGTAALYIALKCMGIKEGDEVIIPVNTFIATAEAVRMSGAIPIMVDVNNLHLINPEHIEKKITSKTKAIIPVHLYGNVCDMDSIIKIAQKHNLLIVEDCAQAHGSKLHEKKVPISNIGCFSFFPGKSLGAYGDAGGIVSNDEEFIKKCKKFSDHGRLDKYVHDEEGFNFRMDVLQAAILNVKLKHLNNALKRKRDIAEIYNKNLQDVVEIPLVLEGVFHTYHLFVIMTQPEKRDELKEFLENNGIKTGVHYPLSLHLQPALKYLGYNEGEFPDSERISKRILSLPMYPELSNEEVVFITDKIKEFFKESH